jgi:SAM-dependent methyltransferase
MLRRGHLSLGTQGLALLRRLWLVDNEQEVDDCIHETIAISRALQEEGQADIGRAPECDVQAGYSLWAQYYETAANPIIQLEEPVIRRFLQDAAPGRALDVACGTGRHLAWLESIGHTAVGADLTPAMLAQARSGTQHSQLCAADMQALPFRSESFDIAVCALALTHLADLQPAVAELARIVRPDGHIVLSDVHPFAVTIGFQAVFRASVGQAFVRNYLHLHCDYLEAFAAAGLKVRHCAEPAFGEPEITILAGTQPPKDPAGLHTHAHRRAYLGLPAVLIWDLERR